MFDQLFLLLMLTTLMSVPLVLAALGGVCSERSGVVNIALEGILLAGAFGTAVISHATGSAWAGLLGGIVAGVVAAALHALMTVTTKVDQIISGLAVNILVAGVTEYGARLVWPGSASRTIPTLPSWKPFAEGKFGDFSNTLVGMPLVVVTALAVAGVWFLIAKTRFGLRLRAVGENPGACDTIGLSVPSLRYAGVLLSGALAGLGGAWLAFYINQFQHGMSAGKGFIAMAAVVVGRWSPLGAAGACVLFAFATALGTACERWKVPVPSELINTLPYVLTIVAVAGFVGRAKPPAALGIAYEKGAR
jgi:simple sugar transport system permease protein